MPSLKQTVTEALRTEIRKREVLAALVDKVIKDHIVTIRKRRTRRGVVQDLVADSLGIGMTSRLRTLVNARMIAMGYGMIYIHGDRYYSGAVIKKTLPGFAKAR